MECRDSLEISSSKRGVQPYLISAAEDLRRYARSRSKMAAAIKIDLR